MLRCAGLHLLPACCLQVLDQVGDEAAIYSPLARGASLLSDRGYLDAEAGGGATPRSLASNGPLVSDGGGTPRSPWCVVCGGAVWPTNQP